MQRESDRGYLVSCKNILLNCRKITQNSNLIWSSKISQKCKKTQRRIVKNKILLCYSTGIEEGEAKMNGVKQYLISLKLKWIFKIFNENFAAGW